MGEYFNRAVLTHAAHELYNQNSTAYCLCAAGSQNCSAKIFTLYMSKF